MLPVLPLATDASTDDARSLTRKVSASSAAHRSTRVSTDDSPLRRRSARTSTNDSSNWTGDYSNPKISKSSTAGTMLGAPSHFIERWRSRSRMLCDSWRFSVLTMALTFYALFGDDFRLSATHKRTDVLFNVLTILCIVVFSVEIVTTSLGKDGYFLGFFFVLDIGSTLTLIFDLTWVAEELFCRSETGGGGQGEIRASRAGRAGARASRTVRLIRLIRLVKLYKTYKAALEMKAQAKQKKQHDASLPKVAPGLPDDTDHEVDDGESGSQDSETEEEPGEAVKETSETRVGKKLSDMTTRRVICLVLVMLFAMPQFSPSSYVQEFPSSAFFGIEMIYQRWREWCYESTPFASSSALPWCLDTVITNATAAQVEARAWYEKYLLQFVYAHHEGANAWQLCWLGLDSRALKQARGNEDYLSELGRLGQERLLGPEYVVAMSQWDQHYVNSDWLLKITALPAEMKRKLSEPWIEQCHGFWGVPVSNTVIDAEQLSVCSITEELRCTEVDKFYPSTRTSQEAEYADMMFAFDIRSTTRLEAALSMVQTIFICLTVGIGAMTFSNDANQLLLNPIERMIAKMEAIKDNPMEAIKMGDNEYRREEIEIAKRKEQLAKSGKLRRLMLSCRSRRVREPMETIILEKTIIKLGGLLALGFGEAGAEIIGQNMKGGASAGVDAMVPGSKVDAIIGFCNIRNFTDATEVLKEKVMLFVNQVGEIVHGCVDDFHGAPNKNIGDSFLLIWRLSGASLDKQTKLADMSVMSLIKILVAINKSPTLAEYRGHPGLLQRLPEYRVEMGFGLHCGWAIEGAIGSEFKIDASYLSPNVNVASRLQAATTQFGVWILLSHFMVNLCSQGMAIMCRLIDHVTVKGSKQPVRLHTIDLDYIKLYVEQRSMDRVIKNRFKVRQVRELRKTDKWLEDYNVCSHFSVDEDLVAMRSTYTDEFFKRFSMAYRNYEAGAWMVARDMLCYCAHAPCDELGSKKIVVEDVMNWHADGPSVTLLRFMQKTNFWPPLEWPGHRELTDK